MLRGVTWHTLFRRICRQNSTPVRIYCWRATEPHTPSPRARLEAVAEFNRAGIPTGVLIAPLMPGINDAPEQLEPLLEACAEAGAVSIGGTALHLRGEVKGLFFDWLRAQRPDLVRLLRAALRARGVRAAGRAASACRTGATGGDDVMARPFSRLGSSRDRTG